VRYEIILIFEFVKFRKLMVWNKKVVSHSLCCQLFRTLYAVRLRSVSLGAHDRSL